MLKASLNLKLLMIVLVAVFAITFAVIGLSSLSGYRQLVTSSDQSQNRIASLLASAEAGNIKFGKDDALTTAFDSYAEDETFNFIYGGAFKLEGNIVAERALDETLATPAKDLAREAMETDALASLVIGNYHLAAVPAHFGKENDLIGALVIGWDRTSIVESAIGTAIQSGLVALLIGAVVLGALAVVLRLLISKPLKGLTSTAVDLANAKFDIEVTGTERKDELGDLARAIEVFRENGMKVASMTEEEKAAAERRTVERAEMMQELQRAFGDVVDAAIAGDMSKRVTSEFPDAELNELARSVNNLVETVDKGISETGGVLAALADTDLTHRVTGDYQGAFDQLKINTNTVAEKLSDVISQVKNTSRGLKTATGEILSGANDLSERTTKQAATIEETSAAMEELANTVLTNAKRAEDASVEARNVSETAEAGGAVMTQANAAMERISASSEKISNIIGMIDDIAFQTNLLALNASVEAARAGEAGKGFAVVAVEVRRLAQSAAEASNEVKALIEQSGTEVGEGSKLVADAAEKLTSMLDAVRQNAELMQSIAADSKEQASAIEEVNTAVRQMDEMTQHNAALVEETNAAIEQTEAQATDLDRIVEVFKLDSAGASAASTKSGGVRELQNKVVNAAKTYLGGKSGGSSAAAAAPAAAAEDDWAEF